MKSVKNLFIFLGLFILDILYSAIIIKLLIYFGINISKYSLISKCIIYIIIEISFMLILYSLYHNEIKKEFKIYTNNFKKDFFLGLKYWIIGLTIMFISNLLINKFYGTIASNQVAVNNELVKKPLYLIFSACISAPFCEEIIFRKSLRKIFNNDILFILVSGIIFGLIHTLSGIGTNQMLYMIPYGIFGIVFGYLYVKTDSIFTSMTVHMIHNTILIIISLFTMGVIK